MQVELIFGFKEIEAIDRHIRLPHKYINKCLNILLVLDG